MFSSYHYLSQTSWHDNEQLYYIEIRYFSFTHERKNQLLYRLHNNQNNNAAWTQNVLRDCSLDKARTFVFICTQCIVQSCRTSRVWLHKLCGLRDNKREATLSENSENITSSGHTVQLWFLSVSDSITCFIQVLLDKEEIEPAISVKLFKPLRS